MASNNGMYIVLCLTVTLLLFNVQANCQSIAPATMNNVQISDHPAHADYKAPVTEGSLLQSNTVTYAQGEQPLSDFCKDPVLPTVSLGQIAREYREGKPVQRPKITVIP
jgi:hypothetical protein